MRCISQVTTSSSLSIDSSSSANCSIDDSARNLELISILDVGGRSWPLLRFCHASQPSVCDWFVAKREKPNPPWGLSKIPAKATVPHWDASTTSLSLVQAERKPSLRLVPLFSLDEPYILLKLYQHPAKAKILLISAWKFLRSQLQLQHLKQCKLNQILNTGNAKRKESLAISHCCSYMQLLFLFVSFFRNILSTKTVGGPVLWSAAIPQIPSRWSQLATSGFTTTLSTATTLRRSVWHQVWLRPEIRSHRQSLLCNLFGLMNLKQNASSPPVASISKKRKQQKLHSENSKWNNFQDRIHWVLPTSSTPHHWLKAWRRRSRQAVALDFFVVEPEKKWFEWTQRLEFLRFLRFLLFSCRCFWWFGDDFGMIWGWFWDDLGMIVGTKWPFGTQPSQSKSMGSVTRNWWTAVWLNAERTASIFAPKVSSPHLSRP